MISESSSIYVALTFTKPGRLEYCTRVCASSVPDLYVPGPGFYVQDIGHFYTFALFSVSVSSFPERVGV